MFCFISYLNTFYIFLVFAFCKYFPSLFFVSVSTFSYSVIDIYVFSLMDEFDTPKKRKKTLHNRMRKKGIGGKGLSDEKKIIASE